jgi:hypothetical protein
MFEIKNPFNAKRAEVKQQPTVVVNEQPTEEENPQSTPEQEEQPKEKVIPQPEEQHPYFFIKAFEIVGNGVFNYIIESNVALQPGFININNKE